MGFFYKFVIVFIGSTLFSLPSFGFRSSSYISNHHTFIRFPERKIVEDSNCKELIEYNIKGLSLKMSQKESLISRSFAKLPWLFVGFLGASLVWTNFIPFSIANHSNSPYPIRGEESIMTKKSHGTSESAVQSKLRWNADVKLADRIVNYNRRYAEHAGYWNQESSLFQEIEAKITSQSTEPIQFYDSVTGKLLFTAPVGRSYEEFKEESLSHGWPSFRDHEVNWENVRALPDGEMVSVTGSHLGHNLPDREGNRYCINLVSVAGYPTSDSISQKTETEAL